jgi:hypothetical protein
VGAACRDVHFRDAAGGPPLLRLLSAAGAGLARLGLPLPPLDEVGLLAAARRATGLEDFGEGSFREGFGALVASLREEAPLSTLGRIAARGQLLAHLRNRLAITDWARRHPELREERIERPLVVIGLPRTGTTLLSFLLAQDPLLRAPLFWETREPCPPPELATRGEDPRIAAAAREIERLYRLVPAMRAMHPMGASLPNECVTLLALDFRCLQFETQFPAPGYGRWLETADPRPAYRMHRLALQLLQSRLPTQAWSLKTPNHLWHLPALLELYPDARLVWTHRDPARVVASVASLVSAFHRTFCREVDPARVAADWNAKLRTGIERGLAFDREQGGGDWCCHVPYAELVRDPLGAVRRIYAHFGDEVGPLHARRMQAWLRQAPAERHGRHRYDLADFGLSAGALAEQYADYRARFGVPLEGAP